MAPDSVDNFSATGAACRPQSFGAEDGRPETCPTTRKMRSRSTNIFLLSLCATIACAQTPSVLELARNAPPEIFADAVIKLVERGEVPPKLLEEAFEAA